MATRLSFLLCIGASFLLFVGGGCIFGGGGGSPASIARPGSIPTATPPASLPEPIVLGSSQPAGPATSVAGGNSSTYVLKSGDTLLVVAGQLGIPAAQQGAWVAEVLRLNGIADATLLQAGVELRLPLVQATTGTPGTGPTATAAAARTPTPTTAARSPTAAATTAAVTPPPAPSATPRPATGGATYTVVAGDYPLLIAQKQGIAPADQTAWASQLVALNNISASGLQISQVLQLPPVPTRTGN